ncbi:hypothetical protein HCU01_30510 [Halomonas cupida]|uniref:NitT/TauT family transport system ATP-binding protein n=1 Tax=Halomonas cupida TaxID=44933 RepID=A0A1M7CE17_9GAMM|nr:CmpA/NrtA family ABC transporter substrate-binding protein [Halomonas cupida]GEN25102.1 hypothetical protein HCU01_30510 [Halomonas cupida]SHL65416.1 NitT/TauT family transport system ATP-binding protein [Halomonas cupida]
MSDTNLSTMATAAPIIPIPELSSLSLGFIPLLDAALLVVAREGGFFMAEGVDVSLSRENAWSTLRDKVAAGMLDGAHMLAPMPLAMSLGLARAPCETLAPVVLSRHGNTLVLSERYAEGMPSPGQTSPTDNAHRLRQYLDQRRQTGARVPARLAMVYPWSCQHLLLRQWLTLGDIDPQSGVELVALPPPRMVDALREGQIDGFCVGEPWGSLAQHRGLGRIVARGADLMPGHPEKVLGVTASWARRYPATLAALIRALRAAANWLNCEVDAPQRTLEWLALPPYLDHSIQHLDQQTLSSDIADLRLGDALRPNLPDFTTLAGQMQDLLGQQGRQIDSPTVEQCYSAVHFDAATHQ